MNIMVVAEDGFTVLSAVDAFESFIWTDRYNKYGDFELYTLASKENIELFKKDRYIVFDQSQHAMIIEKIKITTDAENGNHLTVSGRSLESILDRRIVWNQTIIEANVRNAVNKLLQDSIISPSISARRIENFTHTISYTDDNIPDITIRAQFTGDSVYDAVNTICEAVGIGYLIRLDESGGFSSMLYNGKDRTNAQSANDIVLFSPGFENLIESNYQYDSSGYKNAALVLGEGEGSARKRVELGSSVSGLYRRELYVDARDLSTTTDGGSISDQEYATQLAQRGEEKLLDTVEQTDFDGEIDTVTAFLPNVDFFVGDIVHVENEYGMQQNCRITEMIYSMDENGYRVYPSFEAVFNYTYFVPTDADFFATSEEKLLAVVR